MNWKEDKARKNAIITLVTITVISILLLFTIVTRISFDYDFEKFFPENDEETTTFLENREQFGSDNDFLLIGIESPNGVFKKEFLLDVQKIKEDILKLDYIDSVITPLDLTIDKMRGASMTSKLLREPLLRIDQPDSLIIDSARAMRDERYINTFFSDKISAVSIFVKTKEFLNKEECDYMGVEIARIMQKYDNYTVYYAGRSVGQSYYVNLMQRDLILFISLSIVLLVIFLIIAFKSVWGVMVPMTVVFVSNIWILGIMALLGEPVNVVLTMLPTIIFVVGMSDVVHMMSKYIEELREGKPKMDAVRVAFKEIGLATLLTSVTTAIGFLTLLASTIGPIRIFGLYTAIGVIVAFCMAFTILPSMMILSKPPKLVKQKDIWKKLLQRSFIISIRHPKKIVLITLVIAGASVFFASKMEQNNYLLEDLRADNPMKQNFLFFEDNFAGVRSFEMHVKLKNEEADIFDREVIVEVNKLQDYLKNQYGVGGMISVVTMVKSMNQASWLGLENAYTIPDSAEYRKFDKALNRIVKKYKKALRDTSLLMPKQAELISKYIDTSLSTARITGRIGDIGSKRIAELNEGLAQFYRDSINTDLISYNLTGTAHLIDKNNEQLAGNMLVGLLIAFILVGIIMGLLFRSLRMILISLIPNVIPLVLIAGILGVSGSELKVSISIIFTIAFGICVDDTIHFMSKLKLERMKGKSMLYALKRTYLSTGRAIIITSLILCSGFLMLIFSEFLGTFYVGYLISITLFVAVIADLFLLPALIVLTESRKKK